MSCKPFEASYNWIWHGMTVAVSTLQLEHQEGNKWVYRSKSEPRGIGRLFSERPIQESVLRSHRRRRPSPQLQGG